MAQLVLSEQTGGVHTVRSLTLGAPCCLGGTRGLVSCAERVLQQLRGRGSGSWRPLTLIFSYSLPNCPLFHRNLARRGRGRYLFARKQDGARTRAPALAAGGDDAAPSLHPSTLTCTVVSNVLHAPARAHQCGGRVVILSVGGPVVAMRSSLPTRALQARPTARCSTDALQLHEATTH